MFIKARVSFFIISQNNSENNSIFQEERRNILRLYKLISCVLNFSCYFGVILLYLCC